MNSRSDILIKFKLVLDNLNSNQKVLANKFMNDSNYSVFNHNDKLVIKTRDGVFEFISFIKSKCNC